jgi:hypothetical protein
MTNLDDVASDKDDAASDKDGQKVRKTTRMEVTRTRDSKRMGVAQTQVMLETL